MSANIRKYLAKTLMKIWPAHPKKDDLHLSEIYNLDEYTQAAKEEQNRLKPLSAQLLYDFEKQSYCFFDKFFSHIPAHELYQKRVLDLGCSTGGRLVYWVERYGFEKARGIDINPIFAEAGKLFAASKHIEVDFDTGFGENLPYDSDSYDFVVTYDVFEHVQSVKQVMEECLRVLKPGGRLLAVFPPFFQPFASHLLFATKMPCLHWWFSGKTLTEAYYEIIRERGKEAYWYAREEPKLADWERLPALNGITVAGFRRIIRENKGWELVYWGKIPLLSVGRKSNRVIFRLLRILFYLPASLPVLEEIFLDRACCILEKVED